MIKCLEFVIENIEMIVIGCAEIVKSLIEAHSTSIVKVTRLGDSFLGSCLEMVDDSKLLLAGGTCEGNVTTLLLVDIIKTDSL